MNLKRVKKGEHLHWPTTIADGENRYRGGEGYVLDLDAELEREWCAGQLHKLEDAPEGTEPNDLTLPNAVGARRIAETKPKAEPTTEEKADAAGIMDPALPTGQATEAAAEG